MRKTAALPAPAVPIGDEAAQDLAGAVAVVQVLRPIQEYFDLKEAAAFTRLSTSLLYKLVSAGRLKPSRIGSKLVFSRESLIVFMDKATKTPVECKS
ncbi:MAG: helix-turn-helix domain-containing protein [Spirochaetales bacterium]|nr:helix-turn-helix domain-containing protein [Spirochaetales bacterium]